MDGLVPLLSRVVVEAIDAHVVAQAETRQRGAHLHLRTFRQCRIHQLDSSDRPVDIGGAREADDPHLWRVAVAPDHATHGIREIGGNYLIPDAVIQATVPDFDIAALPDNREVRGEVSLDVMD